MHAPNITGGRRKKQIIPSPIGRKARDCGGIGAAETSGRVPRGETGGVQDA